MVTSFDSSLQPRDVRDRDQRFCHTIEVLRGLDNDPHFHESMIGLCPRIRYRALISPKRSRICAAICMASTDEGPLPSNNVEVAPPEVPIVQYVVLRKDLWVEKGWPLGSIVAQACHASSAGVRTVMLYASFPNIMGLKLDFEKSMLTVPCNCACSHVGDKG